MMEFSEKELSKLKETLFIFLKRTKDEWLNEDDWWGYLDTYKEHDFDINIDTEGCCPELPKGHRCVYFYEIERIEGSTNYVTDSSRSVITFVFDTTSFEIKLATDYKRM